MTKKKLIISCPNCHKELIWSSENPYKPFCSARCKLNDLGDWADEKFKIAGEKTEIPSDDDENND